MKTIIAIGFMDGEALGLEQAEFEEFTENGSMAAMPYVRAKLRKEFSPPDRPRCIEVCKHHLAYVTYEEIPDVK